MEQHPVPQNITSFQFRLIGDMTVKQFAFLAAGVLGGYGCYKLLPLPGIFTIPLGASIVLLGFGLAFVPIEERPMDIWVGSFLKSIYAPTLYIWHREKETATVQPPARQMHPAPPAPLQHTQQIATPLPMAQSAAIPKAALQTPPDMPTTSPPSPTAPPATPVAAAQKPPSKQVITIQTRTEPPATKTAPTAPPAQTLNREPPVVPPPAPPPAPTTTHQSVSAGKKKHGSFLDGIMRLFGTGNAPPQENRPAPKPNNPPTHIPTIKSAVISQKREGGPFDWLSRLFSSSKPSSSALPGTTTSTTAVHTAHFSQKNDSAGLFDNLKTPSVTGSRSNPEPTPPPQPAPPTQQETERRAAEDHAKAQIDTLENKLKQMQTELTQKNATEARLIELQKQLSDILSEREKMSAELVRLKSEAAKKPVAPATPTRPSTVAEVKTYKTPTVQMITADTAIRAGLPKLTTFPNVVTGIIKDNESNLLPGVLVTVRDKEGVPLRALKTNKLGQFAASTPLPDATYILEVEDPRNRYVFDRVQITLNGSILPAVEIIAKSQKELTREKLAKEIFGNQNVT